MKMSMKISTENLMHLRTIIEMTIGADHHNKDNTEIKDKEVLSKEINSPTTRSRKRT